MANEVFISYSRSDYQKVRKIKETIDREVGIECWMDLDGIESDQQFVDVIINAINRHDTILFMMSEASMKSNWALRELAFAEKKHKRIVLVRLDKAEMPDKFSFLYNGKDQIEWINDGQRRKLIKNLRSWFLKIEGVKNDTNEPHHKFTNSFYFKALRVFFVLLLLWCLGVFAYRHFIVTQSRECFNCNGTGMIQGENGNQKCPLCIGTGKY